MDILSALALTVVLNQSPEEQTVCKDFAIMAREVAADRDNGTSIQQEANGVAMGVMRGSVNNPRLQDVEELQKASRAIVVQVYGMWKNDSPDKIYHRFIISCRSSS